MDEEAKSGGRRVTRTFAPSLGHVPEMMPFARLFLYFRRSYAGGGGGGGGIWRYYTDDAAGLKM